MTSAAGTTGAAPPPLVRPCTACWIEVVLLDDEGRGVAREPYWIRLPDGVVREGRLDERGVVRLDDIPCGTCVVRFPRLDAQEILSSSSSPAGRTDWLELQLVDETGDAVAGERYEVALPDGSTRAGRLDAGGRARVEGLPPGTCTVRFPDVDAGDFTEG